MMPVESGEWVAVIDDDLAIRHSLARFFKAHGIPAESYGSANDYVAQQLGGLPKCIVLDVQLDRGMSSFELIDWMDVEGKRVPVIFITGQVDLKPELCDRYPELGQRLRKPFDPQHLIARLRYHLQPSRE
jgi:FixJ family two-component response regulator